jgi:hypothetical protein
MTLGIIFALLAAELFAFAVWAHLRFPAGTDGNRRAHLT